MPTYSHLTRQQLGKYAEYFVKMAFTQHGLDVYSAEVDDKGIDFVIRRAADCYYDVQVKSVRDLTYVFLQKEKCEPRPNLLVALVLFSEGQPPALYLIPSTVWLSPNALFISHDYADRKSKPEWGINLSRKNLPLLQPYLFEEMVAKLDPVKIFNAETQRS
jgi:hypothetical protein